MYQRNITVSVDIDAGLFPLEGIHDVFRERAGEYMQRSMPDHARTMLMLAELLQIGAAAFMRAPMPRMVIPLVPNPGQTKAEEK